MLPLVQDGLLQAGSTPGATQSVSQLSLPVAAQILAVASKAPRPNFN